MIEETQLYEETRASKSTPREDYGTQRREQCKKENRYKEAEDVNDLYSFFPFSPISPEDSIRFYKVRKTGQAFEDVFTTRR